MNVTYIRVSGYGTIGQMGVRAMVVGTHEKILNKNIDSLMN